VASIGANPMRHLDPDTDERVIAGEGGALVGNHARSDKDGGIGDESNNPRKRSEVTDSVTRQSEEIA